MVASFRLPSTSPEKQPSRVSCCCAARTWSGVLTSGALALSRAAVTSGRSRSQVSACASCFKSSFAFLPAACKVVRRFCSSLQAASCLRAASVSAACRASSGASAQLRARPLSRLFGRLGLCWALARALPARLSSARLLLGLLRLLVGLLPAAAAAASCCARVRQQVASAVLLPRASVRLHVRLAAAPASAALACFLGLGKSSFLLRFLARGLVRLSLRLSLALRLRSRFACSLFLCRPLLSGTFDRIDMGLGNVGQNGRREFFDEIRKSSSLLESLILSHARCSSVDGPGGDGGFGVSSEARVGCGRAFGGSSPLPRFSLAICWRARSE